MTDAELYNKAADIIKKGWTQNAFARNEEGFSVTPDGKDATSWCLTGALWLVVRGNKNPKEYYGDVPLTVHNLIKNLGLRESAGVWNDDPNRTKEEVIELLQKAVILTGEENIT